MHRHFASTDVFLSLQIKLDLCIFSLVTFFTCFFFYVMRMYVYVYIKCVNIYIYIKYVIEYIDIEHVFIYIYILNTFSCCH